MGDSIVEARENALSKAPPDGCGTGDDDGLRGGDVTVRVTSRRYETFYDCYDCSGVITSENVFPDTVSELTMPYEDYLTATQDCSGVTNDCNTSCAMRTAGGRVWNGPGWDGVLNCEAGGLPNSGQNFICPNDARSPCNAYQRADLRVYQNGGIFHDQWTVRAAD